MCTSVHTPWCLPLCTNAGAFPASLRLAQVLGDVCTSACISRCPPHGDGMVVTSLLGCEFGSPVQFDSVHFISVFHPEEHLPMSQDWLNFNVGNSTMTRRSVYLTALAAFIAVTTMTLTSILLPRWITYSSVTSSHSPHKHHDSHSPVHVHVSASGSEVFHDYIGLHQRCQTPVTVLAYGKHGKHNGQLKLECFPFPDSRFCSGFHSGPSLGPPPSPSPGPPPPPSDPIPGPNPDPPKPGPDISTGQEKRRFFCTTWKSTAFLMNLSLVLEAATLVGFVVVLVLAGGGQGSGQGGGRGGRGGRRRGNAREMRQERDERKEKEGWKVLAWMIGAVGVGEGLAGGLVVSYSVSFFLSSLFANGYDDGGGSGKGGDEDEDEDDDDGMWATGCGGCPG
ncbi:hypothetical protein B0H65DRAFT_115989 [Neurospora tetraspora]|uniref:Uncharacterized protein n=1 Tax=Neurospora tetraspora TaxID=94610 RepID=A0AAE0JL60_9PEZI|nr:hypothetical protein B0H65DRAFT_115989 [Neurospora tetraspora]